MSGWIWSPGSPECYGQDENAQRQKTTEVNDGGEDRTGSAVGDRLRSGREVRGQDYGRALQARTTGDNPHPRPLVRAEGRRDRRPPRPRLPGERARRHCWHLTRLRVRGRCRTEGRFKGGEERRLRTLA